MTFINDLLRSLSIKAPVYKFEFEFNKSLDDRDQFFLNRDLKNLDFITVKSYLKNFGLKPEESHFLMSHGKLKTDDYSIGILNYYLENEIPKSSIKIVEEKLSDCQKSIRNNYFRIINNANIGDSVEEKLASFVINTNKFFYEISSGGKYTLNYPSSKEIFEKKCSDTYKELMNLYYSNIGTFSDMVLEEIFAYTNTINLYKTVHQIKNKKIQESLSD